MLFSSLLVWRQLSLLVLVFKTGFWWYDFCSFHSSRIAPRFLDFILSLFISLFSHLIAPFIADHVSCGSLPFAIFATPGLDSIFFLCMLCMLGRLFMVSSLRFGFSVVGFYSPSLRLFILFSCIPLCKCAELVFWSFGFFYLEFCSSSLAWALTMFLFSLWGASYLLAGGCVSGALDMRPFVSWWLCSSDDYFFSDPLFWFIALVLDHDPLCSGDDFISYLSFYFFLKSFCSNQDILW